MGSILHLLEVPENGGGDTLFANMYAAYDALSEPTREFLGSLTAIMTIAHDTKLMGILTAALCTATALAINWYNKSEKALKQIRTASPELENELTGILETWQHKPLPDF